MYCTFSNRAAIKLQCVFELQLPECLSVDALPASDLVAIAAGKDVCGHRTIQGSCQQKQRPLRSSNLRHKVLFVTYVYFVKS